MGSNGVTVTKFLQLLVILELFLELSYFLSQIFIAVTVTEVTKVLQVPHLKVTGTVTELPFKSNFPIPVNNRPKFTLKGYIYGLKWLLLPNHSSHHIM